MLAPAIVLPGESEALMFFIAAKQSKDKKLPLADVCFFQHPGISLLTWLSLSAVSSELVNSQISELSVNRGLTAIL